MSQPSIKDSQADKYNDDCIAFVEYMENFTNSIEEFGIEEFGMHYGLVLSLIKTAERLLVLDNFPNSEFIELSEVLSDVADITAKKWLEQKKY